MEFVATCPRGFERLLADELVGVGATGVRPLIGQVSFGGSPEAAYRACLWSRLATRVVVVVARVAASDGDELLASVASLPWEEHLPQGGALSVSARGANNYLRDSRFVALKTKDGICDRLREVRNERPDTGRDGRGLRVEVRLSGERAMVGIDLVGEALFARGGREAPGARALPGLRPDYAAALLALGGWRARASSSSATLFALWPGRGTVMAEALAEARDCAPGLVRSWWAMQGWAQHNQELWDSLVDEADARAEAGTHKRIELLAYDTRDGARMATEQALRSSGYGAGVTVRWLDTPAAAARLARAQDRGLAVADLSWGSEELPALEAACLADMHAVAGLPLVALSKGGSLTAALGTPASSEIPTLLGRDEVTMRFFETSDEIVLSPVVEVAGHTIPVLIKASDQFAARLTKVARLRRKWAKREDVTCYRVYDADLPDYAVSIDVYEGSLTPGRWLQISEYAPPKGINRGLAHQRLLDVLSIAPRVLQVDPSCVGLRVRTRARGGSQYADEGRAEAQNKQWPQVGGAPLAPGAHLIDEGGLTFEVSFSARLDCGIFLDHRDTRARLREMAKRVGSRGRFLNLFAYTGSATCYAADGGIQKTTTVDLSKPSLEWARRNLARNGFSGPDHEFVQADVLSWVTEQRHSRNRWDLIFCDVPTFSNSSRMRKSSFDVQRDHADLIIGVSRLLRVGGTAIFSCNLRDFEPDHAVLERAGVELQDITAETIPEDFARNQRIHHCYVVTRKPRPEGQGTHFSRPTKERRSKGSDTTWRG